MWCPCPTQSSPVPRGGFRREAVELVRSSGRPVKEIARDLGVSRQSLHTWVKRADIDVGRAPGLTTEDREELRKLRRENRILGEEREILKKWTWLARAGARDSIGVTDVLLERVGRASVKLASPPQGRAIVRVV